MIKLAHLALNLLKNTLNKLRNIFLIFAKRVNLHGTMRKVFYDKWYMQALKIEECLSKQGWQYLSSGKDRRVWKRGNVVLKIAYNESGILANKSENKIYKNSKEDRYAPCRLIRDNVLMMKYVKALDDLDPIQYNMIPKWAFDLNDGAQVGIDKQGRILVYDYAEENI